MTRTKAAATATAEPKARLSLIDIGGDELRLQAEMEGLAADLHSPDEDVVANAIVNMETLLLAESQKRDQLNAKADAYCWVYDNLRAQAAYRKAQSQRLADMAKRDEKAADNLLQMLVYVFGKVDPDAKKFEFREHVLTSSRSTSVDYTDREAVPPEFCRTKTVTEPDAALIKAELEKEDGEVEGAFLNHKINWKIR